MKVNLDGLIANAGGTLRNSHDCYGGMYAYSLEELRNHIKDVVNGKHTIEEFAEFYCIKREEPQPADGSQAQLGLEPA